MTLIADATQPASRATAPAESGFADSGGVRIAYGLATGMELAAAGRRS